ncbi:hypothetical protein [Chromobacterium violaceum]|uniref:hypothetical protein n=1 Tax=Chromobacterium violaceum TaxID=536 RepID=UPI00068FF1E2|nr:hypothetical protein [Chromobacterium violaceum]
MLSLLSTRLRLAGRRHWQALHHLRRDLASDCARLLLLAVVGGASLLALNRLSWSGTPGDLLSALAFVLAAMVLLGHVLRRILFPRVQLGLLLASAQREPLASAIVFAAVVMFKACLLLAFVLMFISPGHAAALPGGLPDNAYRNLPIVIGEQRALWPDHPAPSVLAAQVEQETCPSLKSKSCWSERAELKTPRERGVGLGQVTRTARFDTLSDLKRQHSRLLAGWSWDKPYDARLQARALVLQDKRCYDPVRGAADEAERLAMALNCYNAGPGMLAISRSRCAAQDDCDPSRWFGNVEKADGPSRKAGYGQRSFYGISREYVSNIMLKRRGRYRFLDATARL